MEPTVIEPTTVTTIDETSTGRNPDDALDRWARRWVWALPAWAALLGLSTITHQPSARTDFSAYAEYVTTPQFLVSHLGASMLGSALGVIGAVALAVLVIRRGGQRVVLAGLVAFIFGQTLTTAMVGVAAFFQPAIGDAFKGGETIAAPAIDAAVYGRNIFLNFGIGVLALIAGAVMMSRGARAVDGVHPWATRTFAIAIVAFPVTGLSIQVLQPVAGLALAIGAAAIAGALVRPSAAADQPRSEAVPG
jgi:hypothetical protein